jgi:hypothetical protein
VNSTPRPVATISVDVDPVDLHLAGYGFEASPDPLSSAVAMPRLCELFAAVGIRATLFVVGRDAEWHAAPIAAAAAGGHEIASHTHTHPFAFARLPADQQRSELENSKAALEKASGTPCVGFRAPGFDFDAAAARAVYETGYRYDASAYPTPLMLPARLLQGLKSRNLLDALRLRCWPFTFRRDPHRIPMNGGALVEFPVAVTPWLRFPVYHTARYLMTEAQFLRALDGFAHRGESFSYLLHAVDLLGQDEDRVDVRMKRHPGMEQSLQAKRELLEKSLRAIAERFTVATYAERVNGLLANSVASAPAA